MTMFMELFSAAYKVAKILAGVREGESVLVLADTVVNREMVDYVASAIHALGGEAVEMIYETREEVDVEPPKAVSKAMEASDVIIDFVKQYIIHTDAFYNALKSGARICDLTGMTPDMMIRLIGRVDYELMCNLGDELAELTRKAREIRIVTDIGTNISFENDPNRPVWHNDGKVRSKGEYKFLGGQVSWAPIEDSINGVLVVDGFIWPPDEIGILSNPVKLTIKEGRIVKIEGGVEASIFNKWINSFNDEKMFCVAHVSWGFHPKAKYTGVPLEDERVYGTIEFGFGSQSPRFKGKVGLAKSHTDVGLRSPKIYFDDELVVENNKFVHEKLVKLNERLIGGG